ncbi:MAG: hypothetical protein DRP61_03455 [Candidatus Omnitrophota bacterium]|nr:MAG: hypothetical protein DRP61_03455 [Candidatus Omnitrophota bacterium]RKY33547.1 MAG: hypothetical protein DRP69_06215 [Candidatus Omnitrophota bacterium]RKY43191.1 MAG: hypothetical protein DRP80_05860 [Candidatus Omnitrophota bacterium]
MDGVRGESLFLSFLCLFFLFFSNLFKKPFRIKDISYFLRVDLIGIIGYNLSMGIEFNNKIGKTGGLRCC